MNKALKWLFVDILSWRSPHPFTSGCLCGAFVGLLLWVILLNIGRF